MKLFTRMIIVFALVALALSFPLAVGAQSPPTATIACAQFLRSQPSDTSLVLATLLPGEPTMTVTGRDADGVWLVVLRENGQAGWVVDTPCLIVQGNKFDAPLTAPIVYEGPPIATVGCTQYLRNAARNDAARLLILYPSDGTLEIVGRDFVGEWLLVRRADGAQGWVVNTACIITQGNVFDAPVAVDVEMPVPGSPVSASAAAAAAAAANPDDVFSLPPTPTLVPTVAAPVPLPNATVGCTQYLRSAAQNDSARLLILYPSDGVLQILGRDWIGEWLLVRRADGAQGWVVDTPCIVVFGNVFDAPVTLNITSFVPEPAPTATPLPFPGAVPPPPPPPQTVIDPAQVEPEIAPINAGCNALTGPVTVTADRWIVLEFPLVIDSEAEIDAWYRDSAHFLFVDGNAVPVGTINEIDKTEINIDSPHWYGGYRVPIGQLTPGQHDIHWIASLLFERSTIYRDFVAGSHDFTCTIFVEE